MIQLFPNKRPVSCYICVSHRLLPDSTSMCVMWSELLVDEKGTAEDCSAYQDDPMKE